MSAATGAAASHDSPSHDGAAHDYDLIVLGGGAVGENVADYAGRQGLRTAVIEAELVGGECSYWACMPSKALLRSGHALRAARRVPGAREAIQGELDVQAVLDRRSSFTSHGSDAGQVAWLEGAGIDLVRGHGRLVGPGQVQVGGRVYTAGAIALATGSLPVLPGIPGLAESDPWGTRDATTAERIPSCLAIIGGGVAGTELALAYSSLGAQVTLLSRSQLLASEEPFVRDGVEAALRAEGVDVRVGTVPTRVDRDAGGVVHLELADGTTIAADELLVATGRRPRTDGIGLEAVGVDPDTRLRVDESMLVDGTDWLYAVGDVNGRALLTHQGKYQARVAGEAIAARHLGQQLDAGEWGRHAATADSRAVPHVVFTDPEVARVGLTEAAAREAGLSVRTVEHDLGAVAGAALHAEGYTGRAKLVVDESRQVLLGATFLGPDVAELLQAATIAIVGEVPIGRLRHAVPAYPTISEIWLRLLEAYDQAG